MKPPSTTTAALLGAFASALIASLIAAGMMPEPTPCPVAPVCEVCPVVEVAPVVEAVVEPVAE